MVHSLKEIINIFTKYVIQVVLGNTMSPVIFIGNAELIIIKIKINILIVPT